MAFLNACRKARAWQQHLKALSSINSLQYDHTTPAIGWLQLQRFLSTNTSSLAAAAAAEAADVRLAGSVSNSPLKRRRRAPKRPKLDENDIINTAKRIFEIPLDSQDGSLFDDAVEATEGTADSSSNPAEPRPDISSELLEEHYERLSAVDKKREKYPVSPGDTFDVWFEKHKEDLQPFLKFLDTHGANKAKTVAALFTARYWGRKVMLPNKDNNTLKIIKRIQLEESDDDTSISIKESNDKSSLLPFEKMFSDWSDALRKEDIPLTAEDLLNRWPHMLTRQPFKIGTTVAILRAALPEGTDVYELIDKVPRILGIAPLEMQNRILKLQLTTEGELPRMLASVPSLITIAREDNTFSNLRLVREHSRSLREFKSFLYSSPAAIGRPPIFLQRSATAVRESLEKILPPGVDAFELIKAKPQLLLVKGTWLGQRWRAIEDTVCLVDEWKDEFNALIEDAAAAMPATQPAKNNSTINNNNNNSTTSSTTTAVAERLGDGSDAISSPPPPEWLHKDMDLHSLGVNVEEYGHVNVTGGAVSTSKAIKSEIKSGDENIEERIRDDDDDTLVNEESEDATMRATRRRGRKAYSALGEALWMRPWRIQRLEYMVEQVPEEAAGVSFVSAMAVALEQFEERYPEFHDWVRMKEEEGEYYKEKEGGRRKDVF